jgi:predicted DNA-binding protein with PD1-like motif
VKNVKLSANEWLLRLDVGDEIMKSLLAFARESRLPSASFTGIGAVGELKYGYFDLKAKKYRVAEESISLEIVSLVGNITWLDDDPIVHAHIAVGFPDMTVHGGHLVEGHISVTGEIFIRTYGVEIKRGKDERFNLNLIK